MSGSAGRLKAWIAGPSRALCGPARSRPGSDGGLLTMLAPWFIMVVARRGDLAIRGRRPVANEVERDRGPGTRGVGGAVDRCVDRPRVSRSMGKRQAGGRANWSAGEVGMGTGFRGSAGGGAGLPASTSGADLAAEEA